MNGRMKVMIAYDGSGFADTAIDDLRRAGLPPKGEILVVTADLYKTVIPASSEIRALKKLVSERLLAKTVIYTRKETARRVCRS